LTINPINDMPTDFSLVSPADSASIGVEGRIRFVWEESIDIVEDSTVTYALVLHFNDSLHWYRDIETTRQWVTRAELSIVDSLPTDVEWWVWAYDGIDSLRSDITFNLWVAPLSVDNPEDLQPTELALGPAYPNPFNDQITIRFDLPTPGEVFLTIHDATGRQIRILERGTMHAGRYNAVWDSRNESGSKVSSGLYICRIVAPEGIRAERVVLIR